MAGKDDEFLGGGVAFNKVGNHPTGDEVAKIDESGLKPHHIRGIVAAVMVVVLGVVLYLVGEAGLIPGIQHTHPQTRHSSDMDRSFDTAPTVDPDKSTSQ